MAKILIVDDHALNRQFLMVLLGDEGHLLIEATDGTQGLEIAAARHPDLIIADILMPNMDGYEFVARLRSDPALARIPIVFYTAAYHEREAEAMASACGVRWVLLKPATPDLILRTVHEAVGKPRSRHLPAVREADAPRESSLAGLDNQLHTYLTELETSSHLMSRFVRQGRRGEGEVRNLRPAVERLASALTSLQAVGLRLTALIELGIELAAERSPQHLIEIGCRVAQDICVGRYAAIGVGTKNGSALQYFVTRGVDQATRSRMMPPSLRAGVLGTVLQQRQAIRLSNPGGSPQALGLPASHPPIHALLAVPVASPRHVFGWLYLADKLGEPEFSEVDERAASTVAAHLAVFYENLSLYEQIQQQRDQLSMEVGDRKHAQEVLRRTLRARTVLAECNHVMVHAEDEVSLLNAMCRTLVEAGGYRGAWVVYLDYESGEVTPVAHAGERPPGPAFDAAPSSPASIQPQAEPGLVVSLPLKSQDKVFGMLTITEAEAGSFDNEHVTMLKGLADDIAYGVTSLRHRAAREKAERDLRATEEKLSSILDSIDNVVWSATAHEFIYLNSMVERIYGRPVEAFYRDRGLWFKAIHPDDRPAALATHARLDKEPAFVQEYRIVRPDGSIRWIEERARAIHDEQGRVQRVDGIAIDISERKEYAARIEYLADHDALTGLANRNLLTDRMNQAMAQARRNSQQVALLFLDLDRFKGVNDSFGHQLGDALLLEVAARLRQVVREGDTVARQGGDEFILLLTGVNRAEDAVAAAGKIFDVFSTPFHVEGRELFVNTSIGITLFPDDGEDMPTLLRNADTAMYRAKEEQGNAFRFYSREMSERALERAELEGALRRALERKEFELFYQPKVDIRSRRIVGAEALIRWNHPQLGLVSPTRFIPMAEEIGLIMQIGDWVLRTACAQNKAWQEAGLTPISVAVNLSARQFGQDALVHSVARILDELQLAPHHLELELTESIVMNSAEQYVSKLRQLQDLGVQLAIDDFGTGYSSLSYLKRFPLHHLKIDQSFVRDIPSDDDDAAITSSVISLGHNLDLKVIAEGVETEEQVAFLREHNCDEMQGYYFSRPLPAHEFASLLQRAA